MISLIQLVGWLVVCVWAECEREGRHSVPTAALQFTVSLTQHRPRSRWRAARRPTPSLFNDDSVQCWSTAGEWLVALSTPAAYSIQHTAYRPVEAVTSVGSVSQRNDRFTVYHFVKRWRVVNIQMKFCNFKFVVVFDVTFLVTWYNACISVTYWSCCNCRVDDDGRWLKLVNWVKYNAKVCYRHWW